MKNILILASALVSISITHTADYNPWTIHLNYKDQQAVGNNLPKKVIVQFPTTGHSSHTEIDKEIEIELSKQYQIRARVNHSNIDEASKTMTAFVYVDEDEPEGYYIKSDPLE